MTFERLLSFIQHDMRMAHVYQPVMIRLLLDNDGQASDEQVARALLLEDRSQIEYYTHIARNMVGRVLRRRKVVERLKGRFSLAGFDTLTRAQIAELKAACEARLEKYVERRGERIWDHRRKSTGYVSGTLRYEVLKAAKFCCELCGVSADERALEVDHIVPRNKDGSDDITNLQALCYSCNAMKRDRDDTDFRQVRASYDMREKGCPFCELPEDRVVAENELVFSVLDAFPVTSQHYLIIPKRHVANFFELGTPEVRACYTLLREQQVAIQEQDQTVDGFNVGVNVGGVAGQTVMHTHLHLIPRRQGDVKNPRGGVRAVFRDRADYTRDAS